MSLGTLGPGILMGGFFQDPAPYPQPSLLEHKSQQAPKAGTKRDSPGDVPHSQELLGLSFFKNLFSLYLKGRESKSERQKEGSCLLVHSPNTYNSHSRARPCGCQRPVDLRHDPELTPRAALAGSWVRSREART